MNQTLLTIALKLSIATLSVITTPCAAHAQRYLVNGHAATMQEENALVASGFDHGAWHMDGFGITQDVAHADFVPEPRVPQGPVCHYVLDVPLDCDVKVASR